MHTHTILFTPSSSSWNVRGHTFFCQRKGSSPPHPPPCTSLRFSLRMHLRHQHSSRLRTFHLAVPNNSRSRALHHPKKTLQRVAIKSGNRADFVMWYVKSVRWWQKEGMPYYIVVSVGEVINMSIPYSKVYSGVQQELCNRHTPRIRWLFGHCLVIARQALLAVGIMSYAHLQRVSTTRVLNTCTINTNISI